MLYLDHVVEVLWLHDISVKYIDIFSLFRFRDPGHVAFFVFSDDLLSSSFELIFDYPFLLSLAMNFIKTDWRQYSMQIYVRMRSDFFRFFRSTRSFFLVKDFFGLSMMSLFIIYGCKTR